jgi:hypothetical protein
VAAGAQRPEWRSTDELQRHFRKHQRKLAVRTGRITMQARETIRTGKRFNLRDRWTGDWRAGFYDVVMGRLTVLTEDEELIVRHYPCSERHVRDQLWRSDYD